MDNFDQLIKEKLESKTYAYKASAWKNFAQQSGVVAPVSGLKIAAISIATVGALSTGGYLIYNALQPEETPVTANEILVNTDNPEMNEETFAAEDTLSVIQEVESTEFAETQVQQPKAKSVTVPKTTATPKTQPAEEPKKSEPILRERNDRWRVVMINVDTIGPDE